MERVLSKADFYKLFIPDLQASYDVIGPTRQGGATSTYSYSTFGIIDRPIDLEMDYTLNMVSHKKIFFLDNEALYSFKKNGNDVQLENRREVWEREKVIIGLRPCDLTGIASLDKSFAGNNFVDHHYQDKKRKSILIGLTCKTSRPSCFCSSVGAGPDIENGYDLLLTDLGDSFFFRAGTDVGKKLISAEYFRDAAEADMEQRDESLKVLEKGLSRKFDLEKVTSVLEEKFNDEMWKETSDRCYTCGACNMVCPTCSCFTIKEKTKVDNSEGTRVLVWDSCHYERFAQIAGNHNLRAEKNSRFKHRIYDKYHYVPLRNGAVACVGCGRCAEFCPSHIDIRDALERLKEGWC